MDKRTAAGLIADMSTYDIAESIYLATVQGVSGANQNDGMGFNVSAIAELWNIKGTIGNPFGRTKITGRYRGMGITQEMIMNVVAQYPNGISGSSPTFDALLGIGSGAPRRNTSTVSQRPINTNADTDAEDKRIFIGFIIGFILCKFVFHWGWIISIVLALLLGGVFMYLGRNR